MLRQHSVISNSKLGTSKPTDHENHKSAGHSKFTFQKPGAGVAMPIDNRYISGCQVWCFCFER